MFVIMGGTGHVGSHVVVALLDAGKPVTVVTRHPDGAADLRTRGAQIAEADTDDVDALRAAFQCGRRAFLLNPPGDTSKDSDAIERHSAANILAALDGSGLKKVVAESTAGALPGDRIGDLSVLWELERGLAAQAIPAAINRAAYYMSNWDAQLDSVRRTGTLATMFPADFKLPMVAPADLGRFAAERLLSPTGDVGIRAAEGPERYSSRDVANAFAAALGREVRLEVTPAGHWKEAFLDLGFSAEAAESYARMTEVTIEHGSNATDSPWRGGTSLEAYVNALVASSETEALHG